MLRRTLVTAVLALAATASHAQSFPSQPLKIYMPGAPGGSFDTLTRLVANELQEPLKQPVVVENFAGAGGMVSVERCIAARADGHNLCGTYAGNLAIAPYIFPKMAYDPAKDVKPVALLGAIAFVLAVPANSPYKTVQDLLAAARANPGKISYASGGNGTGGHVGGEMIKAATNLQMTHVPYQGSAPASVALLGGHVDWSFEGLPTSLANIKAGKLRALAVSSLKRQPDLPDVPTMAESGFPGFELTSWFALSAPAGTPDAAIAQLNSAINKVLETQKVKDAYASRGAQTIGGTPEQFASFLQSELRLYGRVMRNAKAE